ncbi:MAG: hypothetical protein ACQET1_04950, partial [Gemmatimonadota bacterium]
MPRVLNQHGKPARKVMRSPESMMDMQARTQEDRRYVRGSRYYYDAANKETDDNPAHWTHAD